MDGGGGRFRILILLGSLAMIGSGFLPWWRAGGDTVAGVLVPAQEGIGLEGPGHRHLRRGDRSARAARHRLHARAVGLRPGRSRRPTSSSAWWAARRSSTGAGSCGRWASFRCRSSRRGWRSPRWAWPCSYTAREPASAARAATDCDQAGGRISGERMSHATTTATSRPPRISIGRRSGRKCRGAARRPGLDPPPAQISPRYAWRTCSLAARLAAVSARMILPVWMT